MVKVSVFRNDSSPGISCQIPEGFTVEEFFCKDFLNFPISPVRILVNGHIPSLKDSLNEGDQVLYVREVKATKVRH
ncbi:MAG: hypothetical protein JXB25_12010 [Deltaproteobacteria bacterium]|nr:hypothetical protein [Deltaproteobacteria bacterium]